MQTPTIRKQSSTRKARTNLFLDIGLFLVFLLLLEPKSTGITVHEWLGLAMGATVVVHILLHWEWVKTVIQRFLQQMKSKVRINAILNALIFVAFTAIILSGLLISESILPFFGMKSPGAPFWKVTHHLASDIVLWLVALHIGLHWRWIVNAAKRHIIAPIQGNPQPAAPVVESEQGKVV